MKTRKSNEFTIGQAIELFLQKSNLKYEAACRRVIQNWAQVAGPCIANITEDVWFEQDILKVKLKTSTPSVWRVELTRQDLHGNDQRTQLREAVNREAGVFVCRELRIL